MFRRVHEDAEFKIPTREVAASGSDFAFEVGDAWIRRELADCEVTPARRPGSLTVSVSPTSPGFYVLGTIELHLGATCVRCLRTAALELSIPFKVHMTPGPPAPREVDETVSEDGSLGVGRYQGEEMVLDSLVRESIVLALPMNPHCPEGCSIEDLYRDDE